MCRIFSFRSVIQSKVHQSLVQADNGLCELSQLHPDGWGVSYYVNGSPHVVKSENAAFDDHIFKRVSGVVSSETVLAHIRKATLGSHSILNTHPFQYGKWVFAHNGNIANWDQHKGTLQNLVLPELRPYILGETDSETLFFVLLSFIKKEFGNLIDQPSADDIIQTSKKALKQVTDIIGPFSNNDNGPATDTYLTFIITDGSTLVAFNGGKNLLYSTYKSLCHEASTCSYFEESCHGPSLNNTVNHLLFSSSPIDGENIWLPMNPGDFIGSDSAQGNGRLSLSYSTL